MAVVLIVGSGGREHALAWALSRSPQVTQVYVAPGNAGTQWARQDGQGLHPEAPSENVPIPTDDITALVAFALEKGVDLTVVGTEEPLAAGIVDAFQLSSLRIFGPCEAAARIESSKAFAKDIMTEYGVPTGEYFITDDLMAARRYLDEHPHPLVIKADGLAAGKGVVVCDNPSQAGEALYDMLERRKFGSASETVIIEERLYGEEISVLAFCDGATLKPLLVARDYKRAFDGDQGPNTGGMGAYAPVPELDAATLDALMQQTMQPVVDALAALETPYVGVLFAGLMLTEAGPKVLEFNCRFGDPETEAVLPLLETDLYTLLAACVDGGLGDIALKWREGACVSLVLAAEGYPGASQQGQPITFGPLDERVVIFQAGTTLDDAGQLVTARGRVLNVTALGADLNDARQRAYEAAEAVEFPGKWYRGDIAGGV